MYHICQVGVKREYRQLLVEVADSMHVFAMFGDFYMLTENATSGGDSTQTAPIIGPLIGKHA